MKRTSELLRCWVWWGAEMGPPPAQAASAARLSAAGMPMFYTALTPETACEEVASHSPYDECVVATFTVEQPLRVLDLTAIPEPLSLFDEEYTSGAGRLRDFEFYRDSMTDAFAADDSQAMEYLPSQLLTEAFRWWTTPRIHGIAYSSVAGAAGKNIVPFFEERAGLNAREIGLLELLRAPDVFVEAGWEVLVRRVHDALAKEDVRVGALRAAVAGERNTAVRENFDRLVADLAAR